MSTTRRSAGPTSALPRSIRLYGTLLTGAVIGLTVGFLAAGSWTSPAGSNAAGSAMIGPAQAAQRSAAETAPVSNQAGKSDRLESEAVRSARTRGIEASAIVSHVEIAGPRDAVVTLVDSEGRTVYRSDALRNETLIVRDAIIPSVTVRETTDSTAELRVISIGAPETVTEEPQDRYLEPEILPLRPPHATMTASN